MKRKKQQRKAATEATLRFLEKVGEEHDAVERLMLKEALVLRPDEDISAFMERLQDAIEEAVKWPPEVRHWCVSTVGDGWAILHVVEVTDQGDYEQEYYRLSFSQNEAGDFAVGSELQAVEQKVTWVPSDDPDDQGGGEQGGKDRAGRSTTELGPRLPATQEERREAFAYLASDAKDAGRASTLVREAVVFESYEVSESDMTSPSGQKYLGVLTGYGAVHSVINENLRLYDPDGDGGEDGMRANVDRMAAECREAFAEGKGSIPGALDHDADEQTFQSVATELIGVQMEGVRVAMKFGIVDSSKGRDLKVFSAHKFPLGASTLAMGMWERRIMNEDNPFWHVNKDKAGQVYDHVLRFKILQTDIVRTPSAGVYVSESLKKRIATSMETAPKEAREAYQRFCEDGSKPIDGKCGACKDPRAISGTEQRTQDKENSMNPSQLAEMIDKLDQPARDALAEKLVPGAKALTAKMEEASKILSDAGTKITALEKALGEQGEKVAASEKVISEQGAKIVAFEAITTAQKEAIDKITAERDSKSFDLAVTEAVDKYKTKEHFVSRENVIRKFPLDRSKPAAEQVELANKFFEETVMPSLPRPTQVNAHQVGDAHLAEQYNQGEGAYRGDAVPFALSSVPAGKDDKDKTAGARQ